MTDPACSDIRAHLDTVTDPDELRRLANAWAETAAQHGRNEAFYRDLVQETGRILGRACYRQDDGNYVDEPLALRVPEVARDMVTLRELAASVSHRHPATPVGYAQSVTDADWCIYLNGPGIIFGHGPEDIAAAGADLSNDALPYPRYYKDGAIVPGGEA